MPNGDSHKHVKPHYHKKPKRAPVFIRRLPWLIAGVLIVLAVLYFGPRALELFPVQNVTAIETPRLAPTPMTRPEIIIPETSFENLNNPSLLCDNLFLLVNIARNDKKSPVLVRDKYLDALAMEHCNYMLRKGYSNHDNFEQRADQLLNPGGATTVGENVAEGYYNAASLMDGWLNSPKHRQNILNTAFRRIGIGYMDGYAVQIFSD